MGYKDKEILLPEHQFLTNQFSSNYEQFPGIFNDLPESITDYTEGCHGIDTVSPEVLNTGWIEVDDDTLETRCPIHECTRSVTVSQILGDLVVRCYGSCAFGLPPAVEVEEGMIINPDEIDELTEYPVIKAF